MWDARIQALFNSLGDEVKGKTIGLGGDGRYFNKEAVQTILKIAAAAGVKKVWHVPFRTGGIKVLKATECIKSGC